MRLQMQMQVQMQMQANHEASLTAILERLELPPFRTQSGLCDFVGQVGLVFPRYVHHVQREYCGRQRQRQSRGFGEVRGLPTTSAPDERRKRRKWGQRGGAQYSQ